MTSKMNNMISLSLNQNKIVYFFNTFFFKNIILKFLEQRIPETETEGQLRN